MTAVRHGDGYGTGDRLRTGAEFILFSSDARGGNRTVAGELGSGGLTPGVSNQGSVRR